MTHDLKIQKQYFKEVISGSKKFEIRKNDRNFKVDDYLLLREYDGQARTGRHVVAKVTYIFYGGLFGVDRDYCIMAIDIRCVMCGEESNSKYLCRNCTKEIDFEIKYWEKKLRNIEGKFAKDY